MDKAQIAAIALEVLVKETEKEPAGDIRMRLARRAEMAGYSPADAARFADAVIRKIFKM